MHIRSFIRKAAVELLKAHPQLQEKLQGRIFPSREEHFLEDDLPAIGVYAVDEQAVDTTNRTPRPDWRDLTLVVEILVRANNDLDESLDELCGYVEEALGWREFFSRVIVEKFQQPDPLNDVRYQSSSLEFASDGKRVMGVATLNYLVEYGISVSQELPEFLTAKTDWHASNPEGGIPDATDILNVRG